MSESDANDTIQPAHIAAPVQIHVDMADPKNSIQQPMDSGANKANLNTDYLDFGDVYSNGGSSLGQDKTTSSSDSGTAYTDASIKALQSSDPTLAAALQNAEGHMSAAGFSKFESNVVNLEKNDGPGGSNAQRDADDQSLLADAKKGLSTTDDAAANRAINSALEAHGDNLVSTFGSTFGFTNKSAQAGAKAETGDGSTSIFKKFDNSLEDAYETTKHFAQNLGTELSQFLTGSHS